MLTSQPASDTLPKNFPFPPIQYLYPKPPQNETIRKRRRMNPKGKPKKFTDAECKALGALATNAILKRETYVTIKCKKNIHLPKNFPTTLVKDHVNGLDIREVRATLLLDWLHARGRTQLDSKAVKAMRKEAEKQLRKVDKIIKENT